MSRELNLLFFLTFSLYVSTKADTHTLQYFFTVVTPGINFPEFSIVGQVDGQQIIYYDSNNRTMIPKTEWIMKIDADDPNYWDSETKIAQNQQETFKVNLNATMQRFNQTEGVHTWLNMVACELDDDNTTRGHMQYGYDGEDYISFDPKNLSWVAFTPMALITKRKWDNFIGCNNYLKSYLETECIEGLKKYVSYGNETLERKVIPEASVFLKHFPSPVVVCHATGFFPKAVMISWQKDGEEVLEDVELRETLPNQDGSFQKRSVLKVPAEELQKHNYTCIIQHSSLEKEKVLQVPKDGGMIGVIIGVVAALVVLIAVIFGIVVWKKNSGFKILSQNSIQGSEADSSSITSYSVSVCFPPAELRENEDGMEARIQLPGI